jgi:hypothetical protein
MGTGRDKRKKHDKKLGKESKQKASGQAKTALKTEKRLGRMKKKTNDEDFLNDIDSILEQLRIEESKRMEVLIARDCERPRGRVSCTFTSCVVSSSNAASGQQCAYLFGGERVDGEQSEVFNDLYKFSASSGGSSNSNSNSNNAKNGTNKKSAVTWTKITSVVCPQPRSGHTAQYMQGYVYVFGGEFTSPNQERFKHYSDFWRFCVETNQWEELGSGQQFGGPSARSGSRSCVTKRDFIVFGGFYDAAEDIRYFNDCYAYSFERKAWRVLAKGNDSSGPSARSASHLCIATGDTVDDEEKTFLFVYGGYCKQVEEPDEDVDPRDLKDFGSNERAITRDDCWKLDIYGDKKWSKVKKAGLTPRARAGASSAVHVAKKRMLMFGGVVDHEIKKGDVIVSEFLQDTFTFNYSTEKWFPLTLYAEKNEKIKTEAESKEEARKIAAGETIKGSENFNVRLSDREKAAVRIQATFRGHRVRKAMKLYRVGGVISELLYSPGTGEETPKATAKPRGRINASVCVVGNEMFLYGGMVEIGDVEVILDDVWKLDLGNKSKWVRIDGLSEQCLERLRELDEGAGNGLLSENQESDDDDDDDDGDDGDDDDEE